MFYDFYGLNKQQLNEQLSIVYYLMFGDQAYM